MSKRVEEMILAACRKHPEGMLDTALEPELPGVTVNDRAEALNSLLSSHKLQILVNPADPHSHIYKASAVGDTARCVCQSYCPRGACLAVMSTQCPAFCSSILERSQVQGPDG
jgi:hypothetical protein